MSNLCLLELEVISGLRKGHREIVGDPGSPLTLEEAYTVRSKMTAYPWRLLHVVEVPHV